MKTLNLGIVLDQGADFSLVLGIFDQKSTAIDITGYQFVGEMRLTTDPTSPVVAEFQFEILNQTTNTGQVLWSLPNSVTTALVTSVATTLNYQRQATTFVFDVKMKDPSQYVTRIVQGIAFVSPQATMENV